MKKAHSHSATEILKDKGLKVTKNRLEVLDVIGQSSSPLSAEEIFSKLPKNSCDRATLFRTLKQFTENNLLEMLDFSEGFSRYGLHCEEHHHHHVICTECKKIEPVPFCIPKEFELSLKRRGYTNIQHKMEFFGLCTDCQT